MINSFIIPTRAGDEIVHQLLGDMGMLMDLSFTIDENKESLYEIPMEIRYELIEYYLILNTLNISSQSDISIINRLRNVVNKIVFALIHDKYYYIDINKFIGKSSIDRNVLKDIYSSVVYTKGMDLYLFMLNMLPTVYYEFNLIQFQFDDKEIITAAESNYKNPFKNVEDFSIADCYKTDHFNVVDRTRLYLKKSNKYNKNFIPQLHSKMAWLTIWSWANYACDRKQFSIK